MKIGAVKKRYPGGDPENGPAYLQQWDGDDWVCFVHRPEPDGKYICCAQCGRYICDNDGKRRVR